MKLKPPVGGGKSLS